MKKFLLISFTIVPFVVFGHEGHGDHAGTVLHYLTSWVHYIPIAAVLVVIWLLMSAYLRKGIKYPRKK